MFDDKDVPRSSLVHKGLISEYFQTAAPLTSFEKKNIKNIGNQRSQICHYFFFLCTYFKGTDRLLGIDIFL